MISSIYSRISVSVNADVIDSYCDFDMISKSARDCLSNASGNVACKKV